MPFPPALEGPLDGALILLETRLVVQTIDDAVAALGSGDASAIGAAKRPGAAGGAVDFIGAFFAVIHAVAETMTRQAFPSGAFSLRSFPSMSAFEGPR